MIEFIRVLLLFASVIIVIILGGVAGWFARILWIWVKQPYNLRKWKLLALNITKELVRALQKIPKLAPKQFKALQNILRLTPSKKDLVKHSEVSVLTNKAIALEEKLEALTLVSNKANRVSEKLQDQLDKLTEEIVTLKTHISEEAVSIPSQEEIFALKAQVNEKDLASLTETDVKTIETTSRVKSAAEKAGLSKQINFDLEKLVAILLFVCASVSVLTTFAVILTLASETFQFFADPAVSVWEFLTAREWTPLFAESQRHFGIAPLLTGTLLVTFIALLVGLPLGLGSAIYLSEFATAKVRKAIVPILEVLAGIPTVVLGYFALLFVTPILQNFIPNLNIFNPLSAGLVMGFMILPTVSSISIDSMQAVPRHLREAAYGLGAARFEVVNKVVVPAALSGIVASFILAMSRAIGETMIVSLAAGQKPTLTLDPRETIATMTSFIVQAATGDQPAGSLASHSLFAVGATLFLITLGFNIISQQVVKRFGEKYE